jgi:diacylglycerol kinase
MARVLQTTTGKCLKGYWTAARYCLKGIGKLFENDQMLLGSFWAIFNPLLHTVWLDSHF